MMIVALGRRLSRLPRVLSQTEKLIIAGCLIVFVVLGGIRLAPWHRSTQPDYGGELNEGIIASSVADADREIERLIMAGLTRFDENKQLQPYLAKSWTRSEDGKKYTFTLHDTLDAQTLIDHYNERNDQLPGLRWLAQDDQTIIIELQQPYGLLLDNLTKPYFPYGPYTVTSRTSRTIELIANETFVLGQSFIPKVTIHVYKDERQINQALKRHEITGAVSETLSDSSFQKISFTLPRYIFLFFNVKKEPFQSKEIRQKLADKKNFETPISGIILTSKDETQKKFVNDLIAEWRLLGANFNIEFFNANDFKSKILSEKNYQALVYGVDLGRDEDEYLFWHSSQAGANGQNISQFEDDRVDKFLEEYRLTNDDSARVQKYEELKKILNEERPALKLHQVQVTYQLSKKVKGVKINTGVTPSDRFQNIWEWYIKTK